MIISSVQLLSRSRLFATPRTTACQASCPSPTPRVCPNSCPSSLWCHTTISSSVVPFSSCLQLPSIRVFSSESALCIRWSKYWSFSFNISPSNEHSGLISFRLDWLDLLAIQGTLKSLLQHHSSKASILWCSAFFTVQLSYPHMTTGKTIDLTRWTSVGKVMSLAVFYVRAFHIRWPKYWSFSFSISPSKEYSGLISFGIDWFNLHAVQGTLKSLL